MRVFNEVFCSTSIPRSLADFKRLEIGKKAALITSIALKTLAVVAIAVIAIGSFASPILPILIGTAVTLGILGLAVFKVHQFIKQKMASFILHDPAIPPASEISPYVRKQNHPQPVDGFPTSHCAETAHWRKKLIAAAEHNVILSGNYCGDAAFDEILDLLKNKLETNPSFTALILSSPIFLKDIPKKSKNLTKINQLKTQFPNRFSVVLSDTRWQVGDSIKYITNHTKALTIDYGKYFILGGSAVKKDFDGEGVDNPLQMQTSYYPFIRKPFSLTLCQLQILLSQWMKEHAPAPREVGELLQFLTSFKNKNEEWTPLTQKIDNLISYIQKTPLEKFEKILSCLQTILSSSPTNNPSSGLFQSLLKKFIPRNFRDMDFVFHDKGGEHSQGKMLHLHLLSLAHRWEHLNREDSSQPYDYQKVYQMPAYTQKPVGTQPAAQTLVERMLSKPIPQKAMLTTSVPDFKQHFFYSKKGKFKVFASGPEHNHSDFLKEIITRVNNARSEIVINHMYFNPPKELLNALRNAVRRGVQLSIVTNDIFPGCPKSHRIFGPTNILKLHQLFKGLIDEEQSRVKIFAFRQTKKSLHKKVIVIDKTYTLAGSSNLGFKSLQTTGDHEINFCMKDKTLAAHTLEISEEDQRHSIPIVPPKKTSWETRFRSWIHRTGLILWG